MNSSIGFNVYNILDFVSFQVGRQFELSLLTEVSGKQVTSASSITK